MKLLDLLIFAIIYMLACAIVATVFNPAQYSTSMSGGTPTTIETPSSSGSGAGFFGILSSINWAWAFITFIGGGLTLNIPDLDPFVKIFMLLPFYGAMAYFIYCNIPFLPGRKEG